MNFWSIFIPSFFAFFLALFLFYGVKYISLNLEKKSLKRNVIAEFELNELLLKNLLRELEHLEYLTFRNIAKNNRKIQAIHIINFRRFFTEAYLEKGFVYEKLNPIDIVKLDRILNSMNVEHQRYINSMINEWENSRTEEKSDRRLRTIIENEVSMISEFIKDMRNVRETLEGKRKFLQRR